MLGTNKNKEKLPNNYRIIKFKCDSVKFAIFVFKNRNMYFSLQILGKYYGFPNYIPSKIQNLRGNLKTSRTTDKNILNYFYLYFHRLTIIMLELKCYENCPAQLKKYIYM